MMKFVALVACILVLMTAPALAQEPFVFGDPLPTAPEFAARGDYGVGVQTLALVNPMQVDLLAALAGSETPVYDRPITVEVWYPATIPADAPELTTYADTLGRADEEGSLVPFEFAGRAFRDAVPDATGGPYPLVVVSHGYPGSRYMMTYLTENLASKGYVVVAIDHTESTFPDVGNFGSTLLNRPLDQIFVIDEMGRMSTGDGFLNGLVDADNTAIIGYSMGGYGALNVIGAGYSATLGEFMGPVVAARLEGAEGYAADPRVQAAVLLAPWGGDLTPIGAPGAAMWADSALAEITIPTFWIGGSEDDVSVYETGIARMFDAAVNSDRRLLTYSDALHNVAPNPPPAAAVTLPDYERYADPVWDEAHMNNVNQHFITAFLDLNLKGNADMAAYLNPAVENSNDGVYAVDEAGAFTADHTYWPGFSARTALGLSLRAGASD
jgi:predicted dienelactone hydrolase